MSIMRGMVLTEGIMVRTIEEKQRINRKNHAKRLVAEADTDHLERLRTEFHWRIWKADTVADEDFYVALIKVIEKRLNNPGQPVTTENRNHGD